MSIFPVALAVARGVFFGLVAHRGDLRRHRRGQPGRSRPHRAASSGGLPLRDLVLLDLRRPLRELRHRARPRPAHRQSSGRLSTVPAPGGRRRGPGRRPGRDHRGGGRRAAADVSAPGPEPPRGGTGPDRDPSAAWPRATPPVCRSSSVFIAAVSIGRLRLRGVPHPRPRCLRVVGHPGRCRPCARLAALYLAFASAAIVAVHARLLPSAGWGPLSRPGGDPGYGEFPPPPPPSPPY